MALEALGVVTAILPWEQGSCLKAANTQYNIPGKLQRLPVLPQGFI